MKILNENLRLYSLKYKIVLLYMSFDFTKNKKNIVTTIISIFVLCVIFIVIKNIMDFLNIENSKYIFFLTWFIALSIFYFILPDYNYFTDTE
jgi:hypothetical protein